jgi:hypothetical protein
MRAIKKLAGIALDTIRTCGLHLRRVALYPAGPRPLSQPGPGLIAGVVDNDPINSPNERRPAHDLIGSLQISERLTGI